MREGLSEFLVCLWFVVIIGFIIGGISKDVKIRIRLRKWIRIRSLK